MIIRTIRDSPKGTVWAVGTELNLVNRIAREEAAEGLALIERTVTELA